MKYPKADVSISSKPLVQYLYTNIYDVKFHRTAIIISTDGRTSDLQKERNLTRRLETAWNEGGRVVLSFTMLLIAGFTVLGVDD
jgi:hypothetical protein